MGKKVKIIIILIIFLILILFINSLSSYAEYLNVGNLSTPNIGDFARQSYSTMKNNYTRDDIGKTVNTVSEGTDFWYREYSSRSMCIHESALNTVAGSYYELERIVDLVRNTATIYDNSRNGTTKTNETETVFYNAYMAFLGYYRREC